MFQPCESQGIVVWQSEISQVVTLELCTYRERKRLFSAQKYPNPPKKLFKN